MATLQEQEARERFADRYRQERTDLVGQIEQRVIGGDWGANGYTTIAQADDLADRLDLRPGDLLLDVGAGRGWPGLYVAATTGCSVVLADLPLEGLAVAKARIATEGLEGRASCVNASARDLPFRAETLRCRRPHRRAVLPAPKLAVTRALRRVLRPGGAMAFQVIHTAPDLSEPERRQAHRSGPWAVSSRHAPDELMRRAGFVDVVVVDQTEQFRTTAAAWIREWDSHRAELVALHGEAEFDTRQQDRNVQLQAIDDGLLRRSLVLGRRAT